MNSEDYEDEPVYSPGAYLPLVIDSLPERERDVVNALYYEQISLREIAERNGESHSSVERTHQRALRIMRERYVALERSYREFPV